MAATAARTRTRPAPTRVSAFMTPESLTSFTAVATATGVVWKVLGQVVAPLADKPGAVLCAALVGALLFVYGIARTPSTPPPRALVAEAIIAFFNTMLIASSVLGISSIDSP
jgi:hypothetical protein